MNSAPEFLLRKYESVEFIGNGADGRVYRCVRSGLTTAVKALNQLESVAVKSFQREVEILRGIDHKNVVKLIDAGETDGTHWYESEYANGPDFATMFPWIISSDLDRVNYFGQICLGVQALHDSEPQIIHRDLKPRNILVFQYSEPELRVVLKIADFGMSAIAGDSPQLTTTGAALGTELYMAPERKQNPKIQTKESDIYSLGVTFLEACTGDTTPNSENLDSISEVLRPIIKKMIKHRADERYHSIGEILEDLSAPSASSLIFGREIQPNEPPTLGFSTNRAGELDGVLRALYVVTQENIEARMKLLERTLDRLGSDVHDKKSQIISTIPAEALKLIDEVKPDVLLQLLVRFDHAAENTKDSDFFFNGADTWAWFLVQTYNLSSHSSTKHRCLECLVKVLIRFKITPVKSRMYHLIQKIEDPNDMKYLVIFLREQCFEDLASLLDGVPEQRNLDLEAVELALRGLDKQALKVDS